MIGRKRRGAAGRRGFESFFGLNNVGDLFRFNASNSWGFFSFRRNAGEQEMAVGIIGLCLGMAIAQLVTGSSSWSFAAFALLTIAHLACNYKAPTLLP